MKMLSVQSRENLAEFANEFGIPYGAALNVLLEEILPKMDRDEIRGIFEDSEELAWLHLQVGRYCDIDVGPGGEAKFRARIARFRALAGQELRANKIDDTLIRVTRIA